MVGMVPPTTGGVSASTDRKNRLMKRLIRPLLVVIVLSSLPILPSQADAQGATCRGQQVTIDMNITGSGNGTPGNDVILGTAGADSINGLAGDDTICAGGGSDTVDGGPGRDFIYGGTGADTIHGGSEIDRLRTRAVTPPSQPVAEAAPLLTSLPVRYENPGGIVEVGVATVKQFSYV